MDIKILEEIGLTESEIKVYIALLELGSVKKGPLVKRAGITSSKIYEVMDKLIEKGLASYVVKNKVKHFTAASPSRIKDYIQEKKMKLEQQENNFENILPTLQLMQKFKEKKTDAEVYRGWKGMQTVYNDLLQTLTRGQSYYIFGASKGEDTKKVRSFYMRFNEKVFKRGLKAHIIFNEQARGNIPNVGKTGSVRYLPRTTPAEIVVYKDKTAIVLLEKEPIAILIHGKSIARSFRAYFDIMWNVAKK